MHLTCLTANGHKVQALQPLGADRNCPRLFEPRLVVLSTDVLRFVRSERVDGAWLMQDREREVV